MTEHERATETQIQGHREFLELEPYLDIVREALGDWTICSYEPDPRASGHFKFLGVFGGNTKLATAIKEAVEAATERCIEAVEGVNSYDEDDPMDAAVAAIRSRDD